METKTINIPGHGDINELYAYISIDERGNSGICACTTPMGITPCVGMTREDMPKYKEFLKDMELPPGVRVVLVKYRSMEILEEHGNSRGIQ